MEQAVLARARALGDVFDAVGDAVVLVSADWRPLWWSGALERMLGYSSDEIEHLTAPQVLDSTSLEAARTRYLEREAGGAVSRTLRIRLRRRDGTSFSAELVAAALPELPGGRLVILRDIGELDLREQQVRAAHDELDTILANLPVSVITMDARGRVLRVNPAALRTFGWSAEELQGQPVAVLAAEVSPREHVGYLDRYLERRAPPSVPGKVINRTRRVLAKRRDGSTFPADLRVAEISHPDEPAEFVGVLEDLSEREAAQAKLLRAQRAEALSNLAAGVAHEFNNLLMVVGGNAELLRTDADRALSLDAIEAAVERARGLVRHLLDYAGQGACERAPVELGALVTAFVGVARSVRDHHVPLEVHGVPEALWVEGDAAQIEQVLLALVLNSRDAIREAIAREPGRPASIRVRLSTPSPEVVAIDVEDDGAGMSEAVAGQALDPFFTTKSPDRGSGLGLSSALGIVERIGGRMDIQTTPGVGTRVRITLPRLPADRIPVPASTPELSLPSVEPDAVVLVVDDEEFVRTLLERALEQEGYRVVTAADGVEALERLRGHAVDLILLDLNMPRMTGHAVLDHLSRDPGSPPVLVMSGYTQDELASAVAFVQKPFSLPNLFRLVARHVRRPRATG